MYPALIWLHHAELAVHEIAINNHKEAKRQAILAYAHAIIVYGENANKTKLFVRYLNGEIDGIQYNDILIQSLNNNSNYTEECRMI